MWGRNTAHGGVEVALEQKHRFDGGHGLHGDSDRTPQSFMWVCAPAGTHPCNAIRRHAPRISRFRVMTISITFSLVFPLPILALARAAWSSVFVSVVFVVAALRSARVRVSCAGRVCDARPRRSTLFEGLPRRSLRPQAVGVDATGLKGESRRAPLRERMRGVRH